jgi:hypothetical protein
MTVSISTSAILPIQRRPPQAYSAHPDPPHPRVSHDQSSVVCTPGTRAGQAALGMVHAGRQMSEDLSDKVLMSIFPDILEL